MKTDELMNNSRAQAIKNIEYIESLPSGEKRWYAIRDFYFKLHPEHIPLHKDFIQAVKEIREAHSSKLAMSDSGNFRNTMKIPQFIYVALVTLDHDLLKAMDGKTGNAIEHISKKLYKAFPEYRVARLY